MSGRKGSTAGLSQTRITFIVASTTNLSIVDTNASERADGHKEGQRGNNYEHICLMEHTANCARCDQSMNNKQTIVFSW